MKSKIGVFILLFGMMIAVIITGNLFTRENSGQTDLIEVLDLKGVNELSSIIQKVKENTVKIINTIDVDKVSYGTGFFLESGYLITNSHVVDVEGDILVEYPDGTRTKGELISNDIHSDIALLEVESIKVKALPTVSTTNVNVTDIVFAIGYPYNFSGEASVTSGIVSAKRHSGDIEFIQTDAPITQGSSGGPIINSNGELLGMVTLTDETSSFSMAISRETLVGVVHNLVSDRMVNFIDTVRPKNALSVVLKEVNYLKEDIYNESSLLELVNVEPEIEDAEENNTPVVNEVVESPIQNEIIPAPVEIEPPKPLEKFVTFEEVKGVWFYSGYIDVCQMFTYEVDSYYWYSMTMDSFTGRLQYNAGGALVFAEFEEIFNQGSFKVEGDTLRVNNLYTLTRTPGTEYYNETHMEEGFNWCTDFGF